MHIPNFQKTTFQANYYVRNSGILIKNNILVIMGNLRPLQFA